MKAAAAHRPVPSTEDAKPSKEAKDVKEAKDTKGKKPKGELDFAHALSVHLSASVPVVAPHAQHLQQAAQLLAQSLTHGGHGSTLGATGSGVASHGMSPAHPNAAEHKPHGGNSATAEARSGKSNGAAQTTLSLETPPTASPQTAVAPAPVDVATPTQALAPLPPVTALQALADDALMRGVLMPNHARLTVDTGLRGQLSLEVRVKDGRAEIRATGAAAPLLQGQSQELERVLAASGLSLAHLDVGTQSQQQNPEDRTAPEEALGMGARPVATAAAAPAAERVHRGLMNVKA